jgi:hypothetical protein
MLSLALPTRPNRTCLPSGEVAVTRPRATASIWILAGHRQERQILPCASQSAHENPRKPLAAKSSQTWQIIPTTGWAALSGLGGMN